MNRSAPNEFQILAWVTFPNFVRNRFSTFLGNAFIDGFYLNGLFKKNYVFFPLLFLIGLYIGGVNLLCNGQEVYSASLLIMSLFLVLSCWSSAFGFWLWLGYTIGDILLYHRFFYDNAVLFYIAKTIPLILLFVLLVALPVICKTLRIRSLQKINFISPKGKYLHTAMYSFWYATTIYALTQAIPILLRPVYTWRHNTPSSEVVQPLQDHGWLIAILGFLLGTIRMLVEYKILNEGTLKEFQATLIKSYQSVPNKKTDLLPNKWVKYLGWVFLYTFLMSGLLTEWTDIIIFPALLIFAFFIRDKILSKPNFWTTLLSEIPLIVRFIIANSIAAFLAYYIIKYFWSKGGNAFNPIYYSIFISLLLQFIFIPEIKKK